MLSCWLWRSKQPCSKQPWSKQHIAMCCLWKGWPLGAEGRNPKIAKYSTNNLNELGRKSEIQQRLKHQLTPWFQPVKPWAKEPVMLCLDFWPMDLQDKKWVLFQSTKFVVICYATNRKLVYFLMSTSTNFRPFLG